MIFFASAWLFQMCMVNVSRTDFKPNRTHEKYPKLNIKASASTGYGEELAKNAFNLDGGLVETMAHFLAAKKFMPNERNSQNFSLTKKL